MESEPIILADEIGRFIDRHGMSPITFGRKALNDPHFVRDISSEKPRRVWPETEAKVRDFMASYTPDAAKSKAA